MLASWVSGLLVVVPRLQEHSKFRVRHCVGEHESSLAIGGHSETDAAADVRNTIDLEVELALNRRKSKESRLSADLIFSRVVR